MDQSSPWDIPGAVPLTTGPVRTTAPAPASPPTISNDGAVYEFLVPSPMHILDNADWPPLKCHLLDQEITILKPRSGGVQWTLPGRIGNEPQDVFGCVMTAICSQKADGSYPDPGAIWGKLELLLRWIRVKARHYWLPEGTFGFSAACRGSVVKQVDDRVDYRNFARYAPTVIVRPLSAEIWKTLAETLDSGSEPPVSESLFCDGLQSIVAQDQRKAALELGVACEVEITGLLTAVARGSPVSDGKKQFLDARANFQDRFKDKLRTWPRKMGIMDPRKFNPPKTSARWVDDVIALYGERNSIAHSGILEDASKKLNQYCFGANTLFAFCRAVRSLAGIPTYTYPTASHPHEQLFAIRDGWFDATS